MAGSKKKTSRTRAKSAPKGAAIKKAPKKVPKPAKKPPAAKEISAKRNTAKKRLPRTAPAAKPPAKKAAPGPAPAARPVPTPPAVHAPSARTFADKVRDCATGTGVWFITAGSVEHAAIQRRGADGAVVLLTDAGATEIVAVSNLFETADEARAARY